MPPPNQYGGPSRQSFVYDDLYRLTSAQGRYRFNPGKTRTYQLDLAYDSIHNLLSKQQADVIAQPSGTPITQKKTSYAWTYDYNPSGANSVRPHAPIHIGSRTYRYDANGNQTGWDHDANGTRRNIVWDEENRIQSVFDNGHEKFYKYDDSGERVIKRGPQGETVYVNQYFTLRNREIGTKHVYVGEKRAVSKLMKQDKPGANPQGKTPVEKDLYYFHPDHLGSSNLITDAQGQAYEHLEYFPFGETWVEESTNTQRTPYLFTGKELDEETGLYYFGARYYDPRTSVWQSADPIDRFTPKSPTTGLNLYQYALLNPVRYNDPSGLSEEDPSLWTNIWTKITNTYEGAVQSVKEKIGDVGRSLKAQALPSGARQQALDEAMGVSPAERQAANAEAIEKYGKMTEEAADPYARATVDAALGGAAGQSLAAVGMVAKGVSKVGPVFKTTKEAAAVADNMGFKRISETVKGQAVFRKGNTYITRDVDGHSGGAWKMADSIKALSSKETRAGTYNADLSKRIGD